MVKRLLELQRRAWSVALRTALLPATSLIRRADRHLTWRLSEVCFGAQRPGIYPEVSLGTLLSGDVPVTLRSLPNRSYNVTEMELLAISAIVKQMQARSAFEIGTADGRTTLNIANNMAAGGTVFTLNLPLDQDAGHTQDLPVGYHFSNQRLAASVVQLWGDSQTFDFSPYRQRCQIVFIDADHFEPGVSIDSQSALCLVDRNNSVVLWHDALRFDVQVVLPRFIKSEGLPIHLIAGTNLAALFFLNGQPVAPSEWAVHNACVEQPAEI